jgi:hypothetical protein
MPCKVLLLTKSERTSKEPKSCEKTAQLLHNIWHTWSYQFLLWIHLYDAEWCTYWVHIEVDLHLNSSPSPALTIIHLRSLSICWSAVNWRQFLGHGGKLSCNHGGEVLYCPCFSWALAAATSPFCHRRMPSVHFSLYLYILCSDSILLCRSISCSLLWSFKQPLAISLRSGNLRP